MKRPTAAVNKQAILDWLLRHGDKLVLAVVIAASLRLAWGGFESLRAGGTQPAERPDAIEDLADRARDHIGKEKKPPAGELPKRESLTAAIDPWRKPVVSAGLPADAGLRTPLFAEFNKRTQPDVFPIEDLRAVAGIQVVATKPTAGAGQQADAAAGKLMPFVIVTGLVPVAKQREEFNRRFSTVGFQNPARDTPVWGAYQIERAEVGPKGVGEWKAVMTGRVGIDPFKDRGWDAVANEAGVAELALAPSGKTPVYCGPLPRLAEGTWGTEALHPRLQAGRPGALRTGQTDYKMLRFFDAEVRPTASYTYRVKHVIANPNYNDPSKPEAAIPPQDLENPEFVKAPTLFSPVSKESPPVSVPVPTRILVESLQKTQRPEIRQWKPGWLEIMILGPGSRGRPRALRTLVTEPGGMANVDEKSSDSRNPKVENRRSKGEDIVTNQLLVDMRGSQEDKASIQEPLELLFQRPDGGFEQVTAAESESLINRYRETLPAEEARTDAPREGTKPGQPESPKKPDDPFSSKGK